MPLIHGVEAVEKVPKQILGRNAGKSDLIECATIKDLILGKGRVIPENTVLARQKDFFYRLVIGQELFLIEGEVATSRLHGYFNKLKMITFMEIARQRGKM